MAISYTAIVLNRTSHESLLPLVPQGWDSSKTCHHCTLNMGTWKGDPKLLGTTVTMQVNGFVSDGKVCAVSVTLPSEFSVKGPPHVSVAVTGGGKPFQAGKLDYGQIQRLSNMPMTLTGIVKEVEEGDYSLSESTKKMSLSQLRSTIKEEVLDSLSRHHRMIEEREYSDNDPSLYTIYFDMDGVLADFDGGVENSPHTIAIRDKWESLIVEFPEINDMSDEQIKDFFRGKQANTKKAAIKKVYDELKRIGHAVATKPGFFKNLSPLPGAGEMLRFAKDLTGKNPHILTAPIESAKEQIENEKREWMETEFPGMFDQFICTSDKSGGGRPSSTSILVDDREKYINPWLAAGGIGVLHKNPSDTIRQIKKIFETYGQNESVISQNFFLINRWNVLAGLV